MIAFKWFKNSILVLLTLMASAQNSVALPPGQIPPEQKRVIILKPPTIKAFNFDWDDNIFFMPTKIVLFEKTTGQELEVTTGQFAKIRMRVGKPSGDPENPNPWEKYEIKEGLTGSFKYFKDSPTGNFFRDDIIKAITTSDPSVWMGPSFNDFITALSNPATAAWTTIITARGHSSDEIYEGLEYIRDYMATQGKTIYLPPKKNLYGVDGAANPSHEKVRIMKDILDHLEKVAAEDDIQASFGFSDDDQHNFATAVEEFHEAIMEGWRSKKSSPWPHVKIVTYFTQQDHHKVPPHIEVLKPNGIISRMNFQNALPAQCKALMELTRFHSQSLLLF
jgi:hypothetical protein